MTRERIEHEREINNERHAREKKKKIIQVTTRDLRDHDF
jgi:hypothetical protein